MCSVLPGAAGTHLQGFMDESLHGVTALLVDDDADALELTACLLRLAGADVSVTSSVEDALQLLEEKSWDVVVTDIGMPCLSGYDLIRRARQRGYGVPMIAVTGFDTPEHRHQVFLHGFACHLTKPFDPERLVDVVGGTVRTEAMRQHLGVCRPNSNAAECGGRESPPRW
jgi:CheY-like chemotaxis protein